jgi:hypothetical protein
MSWGRSNDLIFSFDDDDDDNNIHAINLRKIQWVFILYITTESMQMFF